MATVAWGLFCSNSWTWCIGMYLPVILLRSFGWPGFLAFVIPNVLAVRRSDMCFATDAQASNS